MSYVHPTWIERQSRLWPDSQRWMRHDAHRFAPPSVQAKSFAARWIEQRRAEEEAAFDAEVSAFQTEHLALRRELAELKYELAWRRLCRKYGYNPSQPRVPAGNSDGGQWTSEEGGASVSRARSTDVSDRSLAPAGVVLSDASPDPVRSGTQFAENTSRRYSVDLNEEEAPVGVGHTIRSHVGKSDEQLLTVVRERRFNFLTFSAIGRRESSFASVEAANDFVNRTLERNTSAVDLVAGGRVGEEFVTTRFGYVTGREAFRPSPDSEPYMRDTFGVGVLIRHDPRSERGYRVITAYPRND